MKLKKYRKYQAPRVGEATLEAEGIFCQSLRVLMEVDLLDVVTSDTVGEGEDAVTKGTYIEF